MASLLELLCAYPILENLVAFLPLGDLFNLSKTSSTIRVILHGFSIVFVKKSSSLRADRPALAIGRHDTSYWRNLKAKSPLCCSENQHVRGANVKGCLMCSMPVCEACIIKASFGKRDENTFPNRTRSLCVECFDSGNPHQAATLNGEETATLPPYLMRTECVCTAKDGHLCLRCKTKQNSKLETRHNQCYGIGCSKSISDDFGGRVCTWCDLPLPRERSRAESRRDYDMRHLLARTHSSYDQSPEEYTLLDFGEEETVRTSATSTSSAPGMLTSTKKMKAFAYDRFEDKRRMELKKVSERRQNTASALEDERWRKSETLRRSGSMCRAPPPTRIQRPNFSLAAANSTGSHSDSTVSSIVPVDDWSLPSYDSLFVQSSQPSHEETTK